VTKTVFVALLVVPLAVFAFTALHVADREVPISGATRVADSRIEVATVCLPPERLRPTVHEDSQSVAVTVTALDYDPSNTDGCLMGKSVDLASPLGDRRLIDGSTGDEIIVEGR
jgi:hypothetical protein